MKKKLLVLLLIIIVAAFAFVGCAPHPSEGEGEGEGEIEGVLVEFGKEYREDNRVYVANGNNTITVTFPAPVPAGTMVKVDLGDCTGDYSKGATYLFPASDDRTVWEGSVKFDCYSQLGLSGPCYEETCVTIGNDCCATTVLVTSGACEDDTCIAFPVIVDCGKPYGKFVVDVDDCCCYDCAVTIKSAKDTEADLCDPCGPTGTTCCGDDCSGLASWKVDIYSWDGKGHKPFTEATNCCDVPPCLELIDSCEGADCPIECVTKCLDVDWAWVGEVGEEEFLPVPTYYYAVITLKDNVGHTQTYYAVITLNVNPDATEGTKKCTVLVQEYCCDKITEGSNEGKFEWAICGPSGSIGACK